MAEVARLAAGALQRLENARPADSPQVNPHYVRNLTIDGKLHVYQTAPSQTSRNPQVHLIEPAEASLRAGE